MSTIYLVRHFQTGVDNNNPKKQHPSKNLSTKGRKDGQEAVKFFSDKSIEEIMTSKFTRANESGHLAYDLLKKSNSKLRVETSRLLNEWWIPNIWGEKYDNLRSYFEWRSRVFNEKQVTSAFDEESESLWNLYQARVPKVLAFIAESGRNKIVFTHSQLIATTLSYIDNGPNISAEKLILSFGFYFPKVCGSIAIINCDDETKELTILNHGITDHLPR